MSIETQESSRVHRFRDTIALDFPDTDTLYLTPKHAKKIRRIIAEYIEDIEMCGYKDSQLGITEIGSK